MEVRLNEATLRTELRETELKDFLITKVCILACSIFVPPLCCVYILKRSSFLYTETVVNFSIIAVILQIFLICIALRLRPLSRINDPQPLLEKNSNPQAPRKDSTLLKPKMLRSESSLDFEWIKIDSENLEQRYFSSLYKVEKGDYEVKKTHFITYANQDLELKNGTFAITQGAPWEDFAHAMKAKIRPLA